MALSEQGTCKIDNLNYKANGVGRTALSEVELPYTMPGEIVEFERHDYRGKTNFILKKIIEPSPSRITPICEYFGICGGCSLQHVNENFYKNFKSTLINDILSADSMWQNTLLHEIITIPAPSRRRVNLQLIKKNEQIYLGFHKYHSHQIVNIERCPALIADLSNLLMPLKKVFNLVLENLQKSEIDMTMAENGIDISFSITGHAVISENQKKHLQAFAELNNVIRINFENLDNKHETIYLLESPYIILGETKVNIDAKCFLQTSFASDKILAEIVSKYLPLDKQTKIADLFCGRGTFALPLSKHAEVDGYEQDQDAILALRDSAIKNNRNIKLAQRNLFTNPVRSQELAKYDAVVINPPKKGAQSQVQELARSNIKILVYVSCNFQSFFSDAKILCNHGGYKLKEITPIDQFYWNSHVEIVAFFEKTSYRASD